VRRVAEIHARKPLRGDRNRAEGGVVVLAFETLQDRLHLRDGNEAVVSPKDFGCAAPQVDTDAIDRAVGLDMAIRRRVVDRHPQRRFLGDGETDGDEKSERGRKAPNESRGGQKTEEKRWLHQRSSECDSGLLSQQDETRVSSGGAAPSLPLCSKIEESGRQDARR
jgi:hypothetical protein